MKKNTKRGFTLIEILIVIGIIAILAAVVLIAINPARQFAQANNSQRAANANAILNAIGQHMADNKGELPSGVTTNKAEVSEALCDDIVPTYIPAIPTDPTSNSEGASIATCADVDAGDVDYDVQLDADGRVTVFAGNAQLSETIEVTR